MGVFLNFMLNAHLTDCIAFVAALIVTISVTAILLHFFLKTEES